MKYYDIELMEEYYSALKGSPDAPFPVESVNHNPEEVYIRFVYTYFDDADVCMSGTVGKIDFYPLSREASLHLNYIRNFFLLDMDEHYYTRRKNVEAYELRFTIEGMGYLEYDGRSYVLHPGEGYLIDNRRPHFYRTYGDRWFSTCLHFDGSGLPLLYQNFLKNHFVVFHQDEDLLFSDLQYQLIKLYTSAITYREFQVHSGLTSLLTQLLMHMENHSSGRTVGTEPEMIRAAVDYLKNHYSEEISIQQLCTSLHVSREHFSREFRKYLSLSPRDYLTKIRLHQAEKELRGTRLPISEIAEHAGFTNEASFFKIFRNEWGMTPRQFRMSHGDGSH